MAETPHINPVHLDSSKAHQIAAYQAMRGSVIAQTESEDRFQAWIDEGAFSPSLMMRRFQTLEEKRKRTAKEEQAEKAEKKEQQVEKLQEVSEQYQRKNPELISRTLQLLRARLHEDDTQEDILRKVLEMYPDHSLADDALDFLLKTTEGKLLKNIRLAREDFANRFNREIVAGRNIAKQAREFSEQGLGSPTSLRNLYREVTGNPRDANTLFNELTGRFQYEKMKTLIDFLLHSLGGDMKSKGPSIERGELHRLLSETRKLQAILGIFRFFKGRMDLIVSSFAKQGLTLPGIINFELLAKLFMKLLQDRYPSSAKILQLSSQLSIMEELLAQIIIYTQMRDAIRQVAPKLFKTDQHRLDLLKSFLDALEDLEERAEEEDEEEEEEKK